MKYNDYAIALQKHDIGETDRLYAFYTLEKGLMRVQAKSIRKMQAKLPTQVEDFMLSHITVAQNYGAGVLSGAVVEEPFVQLRSDYDALQCVDLVRRVFLKTVEEHAPDKKLFLLFVQYLREMDALSRDGKPVARMEWITNAFLMRFFSLQGYAFHVSTCCVCGTRLRAEKNGFSVHRGGIVCPQCFAAHQCFAVNADTIKALRIIQTNQLSSLTKVMMHATVYKQMNVIVRDIVRWVA